MKIKSAVHDREPIKNLLEVYYCYQEELMEKGLPCDKNNYFLRKTMNQKLNLKELWKKWKNQYHKQLKSQKKLNLI